MTWIDDELVKRGACEQAITWAIGYLSLEDAWNACDRPEWLLWLYARRRPTDDTRRRIVRAACEIARTTAHLWRDPACEAAVSLAERWAAGEAVDRDELRRAGRAAYAVYTGAAYAAAVVAASCTAGAAAYAAAVFAASCTAGAAAYAAYAGAAVYTGAAYAAYACDAGVLKNTICDIIRKHCPLTERTEQ